MQPTEGLIGDKVMRRRLTRSAVLGELDVSLGPGRRPGVAGSERTTALIYSGPTAQAPQSAYHHHLTPYRWSSGRCSRKPVRSRCLGQVGGPRGHAHHEGNAQGVFVDPAGGAEVRVVLSSGQRWPNVRADGGREDERAEEEAT
jgi:hypothetical protein